MNLLPQQGIKKKAHWEDLVDLPGVVDYKDKLHMILTLNSKAHHISIVSDHI